MGGLFQRNRDYDASLGSEQSEQGALQKAGLSSLRETPEITFLTQIALWTMIVGGKKQCPVISILGKETPLE